MRRRILTSLVLLAAVALTGCHHSYSSVSYGYNSGYHDYDDDHYYDYGYSRHGYRSRYPTRYGHRSHHGHHGHRDYCD